MRAAWLQDGVVRVRDDVAMPVPAEGEALIAVGLAGVCGTDLELLRGYAAFTGVPGHEFVGHVVDAPGASEWVGRRVVGEINVRCGACRECRAGRGNHCERRRVLGIRGLHGALAEHLILPVANLHALPDGVSDESAVFAEPLAAALAIQAQVAINRGDRVLVVGAGRLGQLIARTLRTTGCELQVVARHPRQRELLAACGVEHISEDDVAHAAYDVTIEASGAESGFALARWALRPRGTLVLKSTHHGDRAFDFAQLVVDEITLVGSRCGAFAPALHLLESGTIDPTPLVDGIHALDDAPAAFVQAARPGALKILVRPPLL
jgi:2-desacetyl-2-hydroxyethyl bacteriochlorophyllide A dehydrogenase